MFLCSQRYYLRFRGLLLLFEDLINEWTSESIPDLHTFIPYTWEFNVRITDSAELILALNDKNWIDTRYRFCFDILL